MKWKPEGNKPYVYIEIDGGALCIYWDNWTNSYYDKARRRNHLICKTKKEAQAKLRLIKQILRG